LAWTSARPDGFDDGSEGGPVPYTTQYRVSVDTAEKAATPAHDCGIWHKIVDEADVMTTVKAFHEIGFNPTVSIEEDA
jgi:hypothetical protein